METGMSLATLLYRNEMPCDINTIVNFYTLESCLWDCLCQQMWCCLIFCAAQDPGVGPGGARWSRKHTGSWPDQYSQSFPGTRDRIPQCRWQDTRREGMILICWYYQLLYFTYQFELISTSTHCLRVCFHTDTATKPGNEASDPVQYSAHLQSTHEPQELCMQHWRRCWAAHVSVWPWPVWVHQVSSSSFLLIPKSSWDYLSVFCWWMIFSCS